MKEAERLKLLRVDGGVSRQAEEHKKKRRAKVAQLSRVAPGSFAEKLLQAGIFFSPEVYLAIVGFITLTLGGMALKLGPFLAVFVCFAATYYLTVVFLSERAAKRRKNVLPQVPSFIDSLSSAIGTGYNLEAAIVHATESVPDGLLREELDRVVGALKRGLSISEAMNILTHRIQGKEIVSLVVAINLFHGMGGRMLEPFKRLARKIRDQQAVLVRAKRDLVQIQQAFKILFGLSVFAPIVLVFIQPDYLGDAFADSLGRTLIQVAVMLEISALLLFKKVTAINI